MPQQRQRFEMYGSGKRCQIPGFNVIVPHPAALSVARECLYAHAPSSVSYIHLTVYTVISAVRKSIYRVDCYSPHATLGVSTPLLLVLHVCGGKYGAVWRFCVALKIVLVFC